MAATSTANTLFGAPGASDPVMFHPGLVCIKRKFDFSVTPLDVSEVGANQAAFGIPKSFVAIGAFFESGKDKNGKYPAAEAVTLKVADTVNGNDVTIGQGVQLTAWDRYLDQRFQPEIVIGDGCAIGDGAHITAIDRIELGKHVLTGKYVLITDNAHGEADPALLEIAPNKRPLASKGPVIIEDNVWIGEKASILSGVRIGRGAIVGANAVVTRDVPAGTMALGVPARIYPMKPQDHGKQ